MYGHHIQQSMDQPGKVANPASGQLNREKVLCMVTHIARVWVNRVNKVANPARGQQLNRENQDSPVHVVRA